MPSAFIWVAIRSNPQAIRSKGFHPLDEFRLAKVKTIRFSAFASALFRAFPHPSASELCDDLGFLVLRDCTHEMTHQHASRHHPPSNRARQLTQA